jgi:hypothetical protein
MMPTGNGGRASGAGPVCPEVSDISDVDQLLSFATVGQLAQLQRHLADISQGKIAHAAGLGSNARNAGAILTTAIRKGPTDGQLEKLDEIIGVLAPDAERTGGLCSLALRLSAERRVHAASSLTARIPPGWAHGVLKEPPGGETGVLIQGSALMSALMAADKMETAGKSVTSPRNRYAEEMAPLVHKLTLISVAPPTARNYDAQIMLGSLASYAFEPMRGHLEMALRYSPMGFRVWRAIGKLVKLNAKSRHYQPLKSWVERLIGDSEELRKLSLYSGRGLDLDLAITVPAAWSPPGDDWVARALLERARNPEATIRERGTAAMGLWQRAITDDRPDLAETEQELRKLIDEFRDPQARKDAPAGLRWVALTLEHVLDEAAAVCNDWPDPGEAWFDNVQAAADELDRADLPDRLRPGAKNLFRHMILQNAGVYRRHAIETVVTSGWADPMARALGSLLRREQDEAWLRIRAQFALSFLQQRDNWVEDQLVRACRQAHQKLRLDQIPSDQAPPRSHITEMHASLFAIGDCFGVDGAQDRARSARDALADVLTELASLDGERAKILRRATRAAAYLLTFTAQPTDGSQKDLSQQLLERLAGHPDEVTARLSKWALSFRFASDGKVRPLLEAP